MLLKRLYNHDVPTDQWTEREGRAVPPVRGVEIRSAPDHQHFTPRLMDAGQREGWLVRDGNLITLRGVNRTVTYQIVSGPGYYCCHCGRPCDDGRSAREHIAADHEGPSPDPTNPAGYRRDNYYAAVRLEGTAPLPPADAAAAYHTRRQALLAALAAKFRGGEGVSNG